MTDRPAPNVDLLRRTMDEILAHPELHVQKHWATRTECGTAYCFAGWACKLEGHEANQEDLARAGIACETDDGADIQNLATDLLGLDWLSANVLFHENNTTADLKHHVDEIAEYGRIRDTSRWDAPVGYETNGLSS